MGSSRNVRFQQQLGAAGPENGFFSTLTQHAISNSHDTFENVEFLSHLYKLNLATLASLGFPTSPAKEGWRGLQTTKSPKPSSRAHKIWEMHHIDFL